MVSDFLAQHPSGLFFELSEDEWKQAVTKYKSLSEDSDVNYLSRTEGVYKDQSKGLVELAKELGVQLPAKAKSDEIHKILSEHRAFKNATKLQMLASKYNFKIIYCPKYSCELNATEGLWCNQKAFVRSRTDQSFEKMIKLIADSRIHFVERNIVLKLFRRSWRSIEAYSQGQTYGHVLKLFFSQLCKASVQSHRRISKKTINEA
ncbi:unnamed protein product [Rotaria sordida]|uniref:Tc1-like transposase DDE domain-containing protein n=1 Tax=Rotaria sordida TaxID=392033 RepID=A0A815AAH7_9BILA|nr:unnamed protein product [Rotaria sordida]